MMKSREQDIQNNFKDKASKKNIPFISVVLPCLNEEATVHLCVLKAKTALEKSDYSFEIIVVNNGSMDQSKVNALKAGAKIVEEKERGYGNALRAGIEAAKGDVILMADADDTYDLSQISLILNPVLEGKADFVIGNRFSDIQKGAMPFLHRYLGNPLLSFLMRLFFSTLVRDVHCGLRAFTKKAYQQMDLMTTGMEFASEMILRVALLKLKLVQVNISYYVRQGESKLRTLRDGWRHLRLMLLYSPDFLFVLPACLLWVLGLIVVSLLSIGPFIIGDRSFDIHSMLVGAVANMMGLQIGVLGLIAKAYGHFTGLRRDRFIEDWSGRIRLEHGLILGLIMFILGAFLVLKISFSWVQVSFENLMSLRQLILGLVVLSNGLMVTVASFILSLMTIRSKVKK